MQQTVLEVREAMNFEETATGLAGRKTFIKFLPVLFSPIQMNTNHAVNVIKCDAFGSIIRTSRPT